MNYQYSQPEILKDLEDVTFRLTQFWVERERNLTNPEQTAKHERIERIIATLELVQDNLSAIDWD